MKDKKSLVSATYKSETESESELLELLDTIPPPPLLQRETTSQYQMSPLQLPRSINDDTQEEGTEVEKTCRFCQKVFYTDADFKTACPPCYKENQRKCQCGRNIPLDAPKYKTQCTTCWLATRKETHERCPTCTGERADQLRKRKDKRECLDCYNRLRRPTHQRSKTSSRRTENESRENERRKESERTKEPEKTKRRRVLSSSR